MPNLESKRSVAESAASRAIVVDLRGVRKSYGAGATPVLFDLTFHMSAGEMVALVGPSGCGKSTTLNLISGVDRADGGSIVVCGVDMVRADEREVTDLRREKLGIVFQAFHLMPHLTLEENVGLPLALKGTRDERRVREMLDAVGLGPRRGHYPGELSGGEQQRAAIARALVHKPALVVADEPTGNLDTRSGEAALAALDELRRENGAALLLVTHDDRVSARADRVVRMVDGRIVAGEREALGVKD
jgi:putative ABC transport system ATP-binding protein